MLKSGFLSVDTLSDRFFPKKNVVRQSIAAQSTVNSKPKLLSGRLWNVRLLGVLGGGWGGGGYMPVSSQLEPRGSPIPVGNH